MRSRTAVIRLALLGTGALVVLAVAGSLVFAQVGGPRYEANSLEGAWLVQAVLDEPPPGVSPTFQVLANFTHEGGLIQTDSAPPIPFPPFTLHAGPGHGSWVRGAGAREFVYTVANFLFEQNGNAIGLSPTSSRVRLSADEQSYEGRFSLQVRDPAGTPILAGAGNVTARRIPVLPPPATP